MKVQVFSSAFCYGSKYMNLDHLIAEFINKINIREVNKDVVSSLRRTYDLSFDTNDWKNFLNKAIDISVQSNPPKGFKKSHNDNKIVLTDEQRHAYSERIVSDKYKYWEALRETVLDDLYKKVAKDLGKDSTRPKFSLKSEDDKDVNYVMEFDVLEDLEDVDFTALSCEEYVCNVTNEDVEKEIAEFLVKQIKEIESLDNNRAAKDGDIVEVDFVGKLGGVAFGGGTAKNFKFELGKKSMLADFEDGVLGMKPGEDRHIKVKFPNDYQAKKLAGLEADFKVHLHKIFDKGEYSGVEDFVKLNEKNHGFNDIDAFKEAVKRNVDFNTNYMLWILKKDNFLDKLDSVLSFELPQLVLESEFSKAKMNYMQKKVQELQSQNIEEGENTEERMASMKNDIEKDVKELEDAVRAKVKISMFLNDVARKNKIDLHNEDMNAEVVEQATLRGMDPNTFVKQYCNNEDFVNSLRASAFEGKILKFIIDKVNSIKMELTRDEAKSRYEKIFMDSSN